MAILNAANYPAPSAPDTGDLFCIYSGADSDTALMTKAQLFDLAGEGALQLILPLSNDPVTPTLQFGAGGEGIYQSVDNSLDFAISGAKRMYLWSQGLHFVVGPLINGSSGATATNPAFAPFSTAANTGIGGISGEVSIITGGVEAVNVDASQVVGALGHTFFVERVGVSTQRITTVAGPGGQSITATGTAKGLTIKNANEGSGDLTLDTTNGELSLKTANTEAINVDAAQSVTVANSLYMTEQAAALGDTATQGQLWVKNTTPCQLWFTDDAGTDTQIV